MYRPQVNRKLLFKYLLHYGLLLNSDWGGKKLHQTHREYFIVTVKNVPFLLSTEIYALLTVRLVLIRWLDMLTIRL